MIRLATGEQEPIRFLGLLEREAIGRGQRPPHPGLLAIIDQHGAEIRDLLCPGAGALAAGDLAAYAKGLAEVAAVQDWTAITAQTQDWLSLRLIAVCFLAHQMGYLDS